MSSRLLEQTRQYALLMRVDKPIGTMLLLWPALWALWLAGDGHPDPHVFTVIVLGVLLMRAAGCVINDFADRDIDPYVKRTRDRPLAAGRVSPAEALALFAALALIAVGLVLTLNRLTQLLAIGGGLLTVIYPFLKRLISVPQFVLGVAFGWSVPMVYAAQTGSVPPIAWLLFIAVVLWATAYDTIYAMVDRDDDLALGVKSTAILFADADRFVIAVIQLMLLLDLYLVGRLAGLGAWYLGGVAAAALSALYQQRLIRDRDPERCFRAFLNNNLLGAAVFSGILLDYTFA
ncbi:MAG TPA: 4-hydroxybenzoate octaprenyltransferase [Gammaproteobacteria bacterium]|nr:4-hydroxybenzoate octaprenyltransferase [Gammaproteobacteria bacterium]